MDQPPTIAEVAAEFWVDVRRGWSDQPVQKRAEYDDRMARFRLRLAALGAAESVLHLPVERIQEAILNGWTEHALPKAPKGLAWLDELDRSASRTAS